MGEGLIPSLNRSMQGNYRCEYGLKSNSEIVRKIFAR